jgi:hypothetical protein
MIDDSSVLQAVALAVSAFFIVSGAGASSPAGAVHLF